MFKSITYLRDVDNKKQSICKLEDTDFIAEIVIEYGFRLGVEIKMAKEYESRNLNVAANLALYYNWCQKIHGYDLNYIIECNTKYFPEQSKEFYGKYLNDIKKYLMLV